jgi:hypothetical protein
MELDLMQVISTSLSITTCTQVSCQAVRDVSAGMESAYVHLYQCLRFSGELHAMNEHEAMDAAQQ